VFIGSGRAVTEPGPRSGTLACNLVLFSLALAPRGAANASGHEEEACNIPAWVWEWQPVETREVNEDLGVS